MKSANDLLKQLAKLQAGIDKLTTQLANKRAPLEAKAAKIQKVFAKSQKALDKALAAHNKNKDALTQVQAEISALGGEAPAIAQVIVGKRGPGRPKAAAVEAKPKTKAAKKTKAKKKRKPGRPKKELEAKAPKKAKKKVKAKATSKKAKAKAPKAAKAKAPKAAKGGESERPPVKLAMAKVMGKKAMNADGVMEALEAKNWSPNAKEGNHRQYIGYLLSTVKDVFEQAKASGRGYYRVRDDVEWDAKGRPISKEPKAAKPSNGVTSSPGSAVAPAAPNAVANIAARSAAAAAAPSAPETAAAPPVPETAAAPETAPAAAPPDGDTEAVLASIGLVETPAE